MMNSTLAIARKTRNPRVPRPAQKIFSWIAFAALWVATVHSAVAQTPPQAAPQAGNDAARSYFTDVVLTTHEGDDVRLYSDLLEDKVVIISAFFTTCVGVCPVTAANLQKIQRWLGSRLGEDVHLLSLTVDPETDSLDRIREYAENVGAAPGWYFLTGERQNLDVALRKLGLYTDNKEAHSPVFLVGNVRTGLWKKALGMAGANELIEIVDSVLDDRMETRPAQPAQARPVQTPETEASRAGR